MAKKFQDLTIDYTKLIGKMTIGDRVSMLRSGEGQSLLSSLSPYQLAEMFPDYYKKQYPDVGKILKSISDPNFKGRAYTPEEAEIYMEGEKINFAKKTAYQTPRDELSPSLRKKIDTRPQLTPEQKSALNDLAKGKISGDDDRLNFLKEANLSDDELAKAGIRKTFDQNDKPIFSVIPTMASQLSDEEIIKQAAVSSDIGKIVQKYEGPQGVHTISSGVNDPKGGVSYGAHQLSSGAGTMSKYLNSPEAQKYADQFNGLRPGTKEFNDIYRKIAREDPEGFAKSQKDFLIRTHYDPIKNHARALGYDVDNPKVAETLYSIAIQHGGAQQVVSNAGKGSGLTPEDQVKSLFNSRKNYVDRVGFPGEKKRYANEEREILGMKTGLPLNATPDQIAQSRQEMIEKEIETRNSVIAGKINPKLAENTNTQASATPNSAAKGALLAAGTNDWADEEKAYQGIVKSASALKGSGRDVVLVAPAKLVNGQPHAYNAAQRAARDLGVKLVEPEEFGTGNDHYHISTNAAKKIKEQYSNYDVYGDSNAVRLGAKEGQTARTGAGGDEISNIITSQTEQSPAQPVTVNADGGKENINTDEIKAMPIKSLKGDNSVVVDKSNNPLFTMNTKEEQAVYNPKTRQVDVQPISKTDPDQLGEKQAAPMPNETEDLSRSDIRPQQIQQPQVPSSSSRSGDVSVNITDELFKDPSFKRAIAKTRFVDTGDAALGGHFGMANADLG